MSEARAGRRAAQLAARVSAMMLRPGQTWEDIRGEPHSVPNLYRDYVAPLAAIPAICGALGLLMFDTEIFGVGLRRPGVLVLGEMLADFLLTLVEVYVLAVIINALSKPFGGQPDRLQALKLAAYSGTALWAAGVFGLYPDIGWLMSILGGLYSLYLLYLGLPRLMGVAPEHRLTAFAALLLALLIMAVVHSTVTSRLLDSGGPLRVAAVQTSPT